MATNWSIALGVKPPEIPQVQPIGPLDQYQKLLTLRDLMQQQQMGALQLQQAQQQVQERQRLADYFARPQMPGTASPNATASGMPDMSEILRLAPTAGPAVLKNYADALKAQYETRLKGYDVQKAQNDRTIQGLQSVVDEPSKLHAIANAYNNKDINDQDRDYLLSLPYDSPRWKGYLDQALTRNEQLTQAREQDKAQFEKTLRPFQTREAEAKATQQELATRMTGFQQFAQMTPAISSQQDWDAALAQVPESTRKMLPVFYSPAAAELVQYNALTPEQRATLANTMANQAAQRRDAEERLRMQREGLKIRQFQADPLGLFGFGGAGPAGAAPGSVAPQPAAGGGTTLAQEIANFEGWNKDGSVAQRNNNPGNLRAGPGQTGTDARGYAVFPDAQTGWNALQKLIDSHKGQGLTLQEFIGGKPGVYPGYAPAADNNNPAQYAATIAQNLNTSPNAKLDDVAAAAAPRARITPDMTGQELLDALPPNVALQVKAIAEGRQSLTGIRTAALKLQMQGLVQQYDHTADESTLAKRRKTVEDFSTGIEGRQINALNTAIGHMGQLSDAADKLNNTWSPTYNTLANWLSAKTGSPVVTNFNAVRKAVVDELTRVWRGTGGSEADIRSWSDTLDNANSPAQLHDAIKQIGGLLESKLGSLEDQYKQGIGPVGQGRTMLTSEARSTLDRLEARAGGRPVPAQGAGGGQVYKRTATAPNGHKIGTNDGVTWYDVGTGKQVR